MWGEGQLKGAVSWRLGQFMSVHGKQIKHGEVYGHHRRKKDIRNENRGLQTSCETVSRHLETGLNTSKDWSEDLVWSQDVLRPGLETVSILY